MDGYYNCVLHFDAKTVPNGPIHCIQKGRPRSAVDVNRLVLMLILFKIDLYIKREFRSLTGGRVPKRLTRRCRCRYACCSSGGRFVWSRQRTQVAPTQKAWKNHRCRKHYKISISIEFNHFVASWPSLSRLLPYQSYSYLDTLDNASWGICS